MEDKIGERAKIEIDRWSSLLERISDLVYRIATYQAIIAAKRWTLDLQKSVNDTLDSLEIAMSARFPLQLGAADFSETLLSYFRVHILYPTLFDGKEARSLARANQVPELDLIWKSICGFYERNENAARNVMDELTLFGQRGNTAFTI
jgi:hypothetical protein